MHCSDCPSLLAMHLLLSLPSLLEPTVLAECPDSSNASCQFVDFALCEDRWFARRCSACLRLSPGSLSQPLERCHDLHSEQVLHSRLLNYTTTQAHYQLHLTEGTPIGRTRWTSADERKGQTTMPSGAPTNSWTVRAARLAILCANHAEARQVLGSVPSVPFHQLFIGIRPWGGLGSRRLGLITASEIARALSAPVLADNVALRSFDRHHFVAGSPNAAVCADFEAVVFQHGCTQ